MVPAFPFLSCLYTLVVPIAVVVVLLLSCRPCNFIIHLVMTSCPFITPNTYLFEFISVWTVRLASGLSSVCCQGNTHVNQ